MTALDICTDAMTAIGELAQGQSLSPEDQTFTLRRLNNFLLTASAREAFIYNRTITPYALTAFVGNYAIGPTAAPPFNVPRPVKIDRARILGTVGNSGTIIGLKELEIIPYEEFVTYSDKTSTALMPETLYYDNAMPNANLYLFDIPSPSGLQLELTTWTALQQFASIVTVYAMPPEYLEWLTLGLAIALGPGYNKPPDQVTVSRYEQCSQDVISINRRILMPGAPPIEMAPPAAAQPQRTA